MLVMMTYLICLNYMKRLLKTKYFRHAGYLFKDKRLCVPKSSMHELFIREAHKGSLMRHSGVAKTLDILHEHFL